MFINTTVKLKVRPYISDFRQLIDPGIKPLTYIIYARKYN